MFSMLAKPVCVFLILYKTHNSSLITHNSLKVPFKNRQYYSSNLTSMLPLEVCTRRGFWPGW